MQTKYELFIDDGHAWIKVSIAELIRLGICNAISEYSFVRDKHAYLEEDYDASVFLLAKKEKGEKVEFRPRYSERSRIRNYSRFGAI